MFLIELVGHLCVFYVRVPCLKVDCTAVISLSGSVTVKGALCIGANAIMAS